MTNAFLTAEKIIAQGLGLLQRELVLPRFVVRYGRDDFAGAKNDTINIRIPSVLAGREYTFRTRSSPIDYDDLAETSIPVTLDKHVYSAVAITDEELTLDITSWGEQVARPQIRAVAEKLEGYIATAMTGANYKNTVTWDAGDPDDADDTSFRQVAIAARQKLNEENVPAAGRVILLGSAAEASALNSQHLMKVDESGTEDNLREAIIGRIAGFTVVGNVNSVDPDFAVAFHPTAFALANVAPVVPDGAVAGATLTFESLAMRWIRDYDPDYLRDRSVYSAFAGAASVEDGRDMDPDSETFGDLTNENVRAVLLDFTEFGS